MVDKNLGEQELLRRQKKVEIEQLNINPYPAEEFEVTHTTKEIFKEFEIKNATLNVSFAGRIMSKRIMGSASFAEIMDEKGKIQLYIHRDSICAGEDKTLYNTLFKKLLDIGDIIGVKGYVFKTKVGETSVHVTELKLLSKCLRPLPIVKEKIENNEKKIYDAFTDPEQRYRQRYLDLIVNPNVKDIFFKRAKLIQFLRENFINLGCLEVETPVLQPLYGGALAKPFITHHNTLDIDLYLRISHELYLKRLIVGGFKGVFEFAKLFRNEGMSRFHNPEFTAVEAYIAYKDYLWMMDQSEIMLEKVAIKLNGSTEINVGNKIINFKRPWQRYTMYEVIKKFTDIDISGMDEAELRSTAKKLHIAIDDKFSTGKIIDEIFGSKCEPHLIQPTIIKDYPLEMSPLAKKHRDNPKLVERFEIICNGKEIANSYSELNDPIDQKERLELQAQLRKKGDEESMVIDEDFVRALEFGMPPTVGIGIGIDRLAMIMSNSNSIQEVIFFPQMRPEN